MTARLAEDELHNYWEQSNISDRNLARIKELLEHPNSRILTLAQLTADVAQVKPHRRRRAPWLYRHRRDLYDRVIELFGKDYFDFYPDLDEVD